jgi:hypothetical protein
LVLTLYRLYITYIKIHPITGDFYVGQASGMVVDNSDDEVDRVLRRRDNAPHHKNKEGFSPAVADKFSTDKEAIRGREQMLHDYYQKKDKCANKINPISIRNKKRMIYLEAALAAFGDLALLIISYNLL